MDSAHDSEIPLERPCLGSFLGLPLPGNAYLQLSMHGLTAAQFGDLWALARERGLPVEMKYAHKDEGNETRWLSIGKEPVRLIVFAPDDFEDFDTFIDRKMQGLKFIEVTTPEELRAGDRMDRLEVPS